MKFQNTFLFFFLFILKLNAQTCHYEAYRDAIFEEYPERKAEVESAARVIQSYIKDGNILGYRTVVTIPVVVHVVWRNEEQNISDTQIHVQLDVLNRDFRQLNADATTIPTEFKNLAADVEIEFCLIKEMPNGESFSGITRTKTIIKNIGQLAALKSAVQGGEDAWNTEHYLNIWVAEMSKTLLGYASSPSLEINENDGVVINYRYFGLFENSKPYNLGRTLTHEVGHYLNLEHSFGSVFGVCENTDLVADTPLQQFAYYGCPQYPQISCNTTDMTMNFMQLVDDRCMSMFTNGQKERMLATLATARNKLLFNSFCDTNYTNEHDSAILLFPNPAGGILNFRVATHEKIVVTVKLINTIGQTCYQSAINTNEYYHLATKTYLPNGLYFFEVFDKNGTLLEKAKKVIIK